MRSRWQVADSGQYIVMTQSWNCEKNNGLTLYPTERETIDTFNERNHLKH